MSPMERDPTLSTRELSRSPQSRTDARINPELGSNQAQSVENLSLPKIDRVVPGSAELGETKSQLARLAQGLSNQLQAPTVASALASQLQLETRILGGPASATPVTAALSQTLAKLKASTNR